VRAGNASSIYVRQPEATASQNFNVTFVDQIQPIETCALLNFFKPIEKCPEEIPRPLITSYIPRVHSGTGKLCNGKISPPSCVAIRM
jgi:hypothetical protein